MTEREKLASELHDIYMVEADKQGNTRNQRRYEDLAENVKEYDRILADFIMADRKRIVEPLIKAVEESDRIGSDESTAPAWQRLDKAVYETLKLAGIQ